MMKTYIVVLNYNYCSIDHYEYDKILSNEEVENILSHKYNIDEISWMMSYEPIFESTTYNN